MLLLYFNRMENQQERKKPEKADLGASVTTSGKDSGRERTLNPLYLGSAGCLATGAQECWEFKGPTNPGITLFPHFMYLQTGRWELFSHLCKSQGAPVHKIEMKYGKLLSN